MIFHDLTELKQYIDRMVGLGLGHARPMLDRRGCACGDEPAPLGDPGDAILWREDDGGLADEVNVIVNGEYQRSDLWPSCNWLYNVAVGGRRETRGSMAFLLPIGALAVLLVLDVRFPLLFWNLRHGLEVYGGEPTDWYYAMQRGSRIASIIGVFVLAAMSFAVH